MKAIICALLLISSSLYAGKAPFASQSDMLVDLSDGILNGIYHHRPGFDRYPCERSVWIEGFGSHRRRESSSDRERYENSLGGILGGFNFSLSCENYLNFFVGGSWGELEICNENNFDTESVFFGMSWEKFCGCRFFGLAIAGGYLELERHYERVREEPRGVFITPEITYAQELDCFYCYPIFSATLRYAGFFSRDYQHRLTEGTLHVQDRSVQLFTLRGELAAPLSCWQPYLGVAGRFQFDGNHIKGALILDREHFSDGLDNVMVYGLLGFRAAKRCGCVDLQANFEGSYDSDCSWRVLGELSLNYAY